MNLDEITLTREDLYAQVWLEPMTILSEKYGISNVGLKKICKKLNVPVPGIGYWQRKKCGQQVMQTPLLKLSDPSAMKSYTIEKRNILSQKPKLVREIQDENINELIEQERMPKNKIRVPKHIISPHAYIRRTEAIYKKHRINFAGLLELEGIGRLPIRVSPKCFPRAMRIMDTLIKALEQRNFRITLSSSYGEHPHIFLLGEMIRFSFSETFTRKSRKLTKEEELEKDLYPQHWTKKYNYFPTGNLRFKIDVYSSNDLKTAWINGDDGRLEEQLNSIVIGLIRAAYEASEWRLEKERRDREWREEQLRREERERLRREEEKRVRDLFKHVDLWKKSQQLREFLEAFRIAYIFKHGKIEPGTKVDAWLRWAERCADRVDPLSQELFDVFEGEVSIT